jgi:LacI family transcriptional regulator
LRNNPSINKNIREKILDTAREMGYRSNTIASSLLSKKTNTSGVIIPRLNSYFVASVLADMEDIANEEGFNLINSQSPENAEKEVANAHTMFNNRVDGLLVSLASDSENIDHLNPIKKNIPVLFFDPTSSTSERTSVIIDNFRSAYNVTKHLLEQGCRRISHLAGNMWHIVYSERLRGYKEALRDHKIPYDEKLFYVCRLDETSGTAAAERILKLKPEKWPNAVFSVIDTASLHCIIWLKAAGIRIPEDIAFASFNNDPISKVIEPNLTTVNYSGYRIGEIAVRRLINHLKGISSAKTTNTILLRSDLIICESSLKKKSL